MGKLGIFILALTVVYSRYNVRAEDEEAAKKYLKELEPRYSEACNKQTLIYWAYETNVTKENEDVSITAANVFSEFQASIQKEINEKFPEWEKFKDPLMVREFKNLAISGPGNMSKENTEAMNALSSQMESAYASATVCEYKNPKNCTLHLDPEITNALRATKDFDELEHYWTAWHQVMGAKVTADDFEKFAKYQNEMAVANRFKDMSEFWADSYDDGSKGFNADKFMNDMMTVWKKLKPYYSKLHAYVRMKLRPTYKDHIDKEGYMPMNIFGNMWAQDWTYLDSLTKPYPSEKNLDATDAMVAAKYDADKMFKEADKFFGSLGLEQMTEKFWKDTMFTRPTDGREVVCHASAEDFCTGRTNGDYRIKMCAQINMEDLVTIHHEMGHIEYYMQYKDENSVFRTGANPGFHEAIGDALGLAVTTPSHLTCVLHLDLGLEIDCDGSSGSKTETQQLGRGAAKKDLEKFKKWQEKVRTKLAAVALKILSKHKTNATDALSKGANASDALPKGANNVSDELPKGVTKMDINFLYYKALEKFSFFPFALFIDIWRFEVFSGKLKKEKYTDRWWELRKEYQGLVPPNKRKSTNFDPAAKYHIIANVEYIRYFVANILQFQFFEAMCIAAGEYSREKPKKPLYQCDFTGSKDAGKALGDMMKLGFTKPWPEALEKIAKVKTLSIEPLMNYFKPLFDKITKDLKIGNERPCFGKQVC